MTSPLRISRPWLSCSPQFLAPRVIGLLREFRKLGQEKARHIMDTKYGSLLYFCIGWTHMDNWVNFFTFLLPLCQHEESVWLWALLITDQLSGWLRRQNKILLPLVAPELLCPLELPSPFPERNWCSRVMSHSADQLPKFLDLGPLTLRNSPLPWRVTWENILFFSLNS